MAPCLACHGEGGSSENADVPSLGAQPADYTLIQLYLFREGQRKVAAMNEAAKGLSDDDLRQFAQAIAGLPAPTPMETGGEAARLARGETLIRQHRCDFCHMSELQGRDNVPRLAAQREDYLLQALRAFKSNARVGYDPAMVEIMPRLADADLVDLAYTIARKR